MGTFSFVLPVLTCLLHRRPLQEMLSHRQPRPHETFFPSGKLGQGPKVESEAVGRRRAATAAAEAEAPPARQRVGDPPALLRLLLGAGRIEQALRVVLKIVPTPAIEVRIVCCLASNPPPVRRSCYRSIMPKTQ